MTVPPDVLKARYPDPPPPSAWCGWRRKKGGAFGGGAWQHFPEADAATKGQCYQLCMERSELVGHEGNWEYMILAAGQQPRPV